MTRRNDLILPAPDQRHKRHHLRSHRHDSTRGLFRCGRVDHGNGGVVRSVGKRVSGRREGNHVNPSPRRAGVLTANGAERKALSPDGGFGTLVNALDERREDTRVGVGGTGGEEHRVRVPGDGEGRRAQGLLEVFSSRRSRRRSRALRIRRRISSRRWGQRTCVTARLIRRRTRVGFQPVGDGFQTRAFRYEELPVQAHDASQPATIDRTSRTLRAGDDFAGLRREVNAGNSLILSGKLVF